MVAHALSQVLRLVTYFRYAELFQNGISPQFGILKKQIHALTSMGKAVLLDLWQGCLVPSGQGAEVAGGYQFPLYEQVPGTSLSQGIGILHFVPSITRCPCESRVLTARAEDAAKTSPRTLGIKPISLVLSLLSWSDSPGGPLPGSDERASTLACSASSAGKKKIK